MKKCIAIMLFAVMLFTTACQTLPADTSGAAPEAPLPSTQPPVPETTDSNFEVLVPGAIYSSITPPQPGEGVWYAETEAELAAIDFDSIPEAPVICITAPIVFSEPFVIDRPVTLYYYCAETEVDCFSGSGILICTQEEGQIRIFSTSDALIDAGFLTVDAPSCDLIWKGDSLPAEESFALYCNTKTVNGVARNTLGGIGQSPSNIVLMASNTGKPYAGSNAYRR